MNQRERVLASCVAGVIVVSGGYALIKSQVYEPGEKLKADIASAREYRGKLEVRLNGSEKITRGWQEQTGQTLDQEWFAAHQAFREDVSLLLKRNNLTAGLKINKHKERTDKKGPREGFVELPLSVRVNGQLGDLDNFLKDFFQRAYLVRLDKLQLSAEHTSKSKRKKGGSTEPQLGITMTLSTLVLPKVADVDHPTFDLAAFNHPDPEAELVLAAAPRLRWQEDMDRYGEIVEKNIFENYEPPPPKVKTAPRPKEVVKKTEPKTEDKPKPVPVDLRRDAGKFVLSGMGRLDDGPIAYVTRSDQPAEPPTLYRLNDDIDDGRLVLIVPRGIVVRATPPARGARQPAKNYFYPLGATFAEREEVDASVHPELERQLRVVLRQ